MSVIVRTLQERINIDTGEQTTAVVSIEPKDNNAFHAGHVKLITQAKSVADVVFVNFFHSYPFSDVLYGSETNFYRDSTFSFIPNEQQMIDWCDLQGVDYIWIAPSGFHTEFFDGYDFNIVKQRANDIYTLEGYTTTNIEIERHIKRIIVSLIPLIDNNWYSYDYRISSWKDGLVRYFEKHFYEKYLGTNVIVIDPILEINGLPLSIGLNKFSSDAKGKMGNIKKFIKTLNKNQILNNIQQFKDNIDSYVLTLSDETIIKIRDIEVIESSFLPTNSLMIYAYIDIGDGPTMASTGLNILF
jgi:hypothetical protein